MSSAFPSLEKTERSLDEPRPANVGAQLIRFHIFGACEIRGGDRFVITPTAERLFSLLVVCSFSKAKAVTRHQLLTLIWPELDEAPARHTLRQAIYKLRKNGVNLRIQGDLVSLPPEMIDPSFSTQRTVESFQRNVIEGPEPFGEFLEGWTPRSEALQQWLAETRDRLHPDLRAVLLATLRNLRDRAQWKECERWSAALLELDPLNEEGTLLLAESKAAAGSKQSALHVLDAYQREIGYDSPIRLAPRTLRKRISLIHEEAASPAGSGSSRFVGREQLLDDWTRVIRKSPGRGEAIIYVGSAGIGKSRLLHEVENRTRIEGIEVLRLTALRSTQGEPLSIFLPITQKLLSLPGAIGCAPQSLERLGALSNNIVLRVGSADSIAPAPSSDGLLHALIDVFDAISAEKSLLVCIDDVQWADSLSVSLILRLAEKASSMPLYLAVTAREDSLAAHQTFTGCDLFRVEAIEPLNAEDRQLLVANTARSVGVQLPAGIEAAAAAASCGVPLYIEQIVRHFAVSGAGASIPNALQPLLQARIASLSEDARTMLRFVAALGRYASVRYVADAAQLPSHRVLRALTELESAHVIQVEAEILVLHESVRSLIHTNDGKASSQWISRRAYEVLSMAMATAPTAALAHEVVRHASEANIGEESLPLVRMVTEHMISHGLAHWAKELTGNALKRFSHRASPDFVRHSILVFARTGEWRSVRHLANEHHLDNREVAYHSSDPVLFLAIANAIYRTSPRENHALLEAQSCEIACRSDLPDSTRRTAAEFALLVSSNSLSSNTASSLRTGLKHLLFSDSHPSDDWLMVAMMFHCIHGDLDRAHELAKHVAEQALQVSEKPESIVALSNAALAARLAGDMTRAITYNQRAVDISENLKLAHLGVYPSFQLGLICFGDREFGKAERWLNQIEGTTNGNPDPRALDMLETLAAVIAIGRGDYEAALSRLEGLRERLPDHDVYPRAHFQRVAIELWALNDTAPERSGHVLCKAEQALECLKDATGSDLLSFAVLRAYVLRNEHAKARERLVAYLERRRDQTPLPWYLTDLMSELEVPSAP